MKRWRILALGLGLIVMVTISVRYIFSPAVEVEIGERTVRLETTACGDASGTSGVGVIISDGLVLTVAHTVIGAGQVTATLADGRSELSEIRYISPRTDLAILAVESAKAAPVEFARTQKGATVVVAGGPSGTFRTKVLRPVEVRIEEVRSSERSSRFGYELGVNVQLGDSGSGVYDLDGRLVGIVFGRKPEGELRSFATGQVDLQDVLEVIPNDLFLCDPAAHRVVSTTEP